MSPLPTPKQPQPQHLKDWYPYYAGYTADFADATLRAFFPDAKTLVDPWNGSGTTTTVGAIHGAACTGVDINPAMTIIAKARLTPTSIQESLTPVGREILQAARRRRPRLRTHDPLGRWLRASAVEELRRIQAAIDLVVDDDGDLRLRLANDPEQAASGAPILAAFYYTALFAVTRDLLQSFRASNPTWLRYPPSSRHRLAPGRDLIGRIFLERIEFLAARLTVPPEVQTDQIELRTGSVLELDDESRFDACLTSPPYATRVDYIRDGLAELALIGVGSEQLDALRVRATGTPVVRGTDRSRYELRSEAATGTLAAVRKDDSHGSANYYAPWLGNYFRDLGLSLGRVCRSVKAGGRIGILVQDSHYKQVHIDLQRIVSEVLMAEGKKMLFREDFPVRHSLAQMNPAARPRPGGRKSTESLLVFG